VSHLAGRAVGGLFGVWWRTNLFPPLLRIPDRPGADRGGARIVVLRSSGGVLRGWKLALAVYVVAGLSGSPRISSVRLEGESAPSLRVVPTSVFNLRHPHSSLVIPLVLLALVLARHPHAGTSPATAQLRYPFSRCACCCVGFLYCNNVIMHEMYGYRAHKTMRTSYVQLRCERRGNPAFDEDAVRNSSTAPAITASIRREEHRRTAGAVLRPRFGIAAA